MKEYWTRWTRNWLRVASGALIVGCIIGPLIVGTYVGDLLDSLLPLAAGITLFIIGVIAGIMAFEV